MYMNVCTPLFIELYEWGEHESLDETLMNVLLCVGTIIGTSLGSKMMQNGRRKALITSGIIGFFGSMLTFIINWYVFLLAKTICGINYGMTGVVMARMIEEYVPTAYYGVCAAIGILSIQAGIFLASLTGLVLPPDTDTEALKETKAYFFIYSV